MIQVAIADDHKIFREGLRRILESKEDIEVVGEAGDGPQTLQLVRSCEDLDVLVLDISMPGRSGIDLIKQIRLERPKLSILILSMHAEQQYSVRAIRAGASAYLTKDSPSEYVLAGIRKLAAGGVYISAPVAELLALDSRPTSERLPHETLSDREFQVFQRLVAGDPVSGIASQLHVSIKTVSTHKARVLEKMHCSSVADLVRYSLAHDLGVDAVRNGEVAERGGR